jgi:hypothetical protein
MLDSARHLTDNVLLHVSQPLSEVMDVKTELQSERFKKVSEAGGLA